MRVGTEEAFGPLYHTVTVMNEGELWVWGMGLFGQLGLGDRDNRLAPTLVGAIDAFREMQVHTVCVVTHKWQQALANSQAA